MTAAVQIVDQAIVRQAALAAKRVEPLEDRVPVTNDAFGVDYSHCAFVRNLQSFAPIGIFERRNAIRLGKATDQRGEIGASGVPHGRGDIIAVGIAWPGAHPRSVARVHQPPRGIGRQTTRLGGLGEPA
ncbi:hypothetical protein [Bradyrhizobium sp. NAS80.1]|uniref:hypothetical protein n=1 Tax=Bradyrhizobium sp. NAS80.1 TaxID=1680159 RepID=UPI001FDA507B|nr:hypothetical protein [Bradyrhizobium sp. NAS80.1]